MSSNVDPAKIGLPASDFEPIFRKARVLVEELDGAKGASDKASKIGRYLAAQVGREVTLSVNGRTGTARLCVHPTRANKKLYYFRVRWDEPADGGNVDVEESTTAELSDGLAELEDRRDNDCAGRMAEPDSSEPPAGRPANEGNEEQW